MSIPQTPPAQRRNIPSPSGSPTTPPRSSFLSPNNSPAIRAPPSSPATHDSPELLSLAADGRRSSAAKIVLASMSMPVPAHSAAKIVWELYVWDGYKYGSGGATRLTETADLEVAIERVREDFRKKHADRPDIYPSLESIPTDMHYEEGRAWPRGAFFAWPKSAEQHNVIKIAAIHGSAEHEHEIEYYVRRKERVAGLRSPDA